MVRSLAAALVMGVLLLLGGCGAGSEYVVSRLDVDRDGWDTLRVDAQFARDQAIGTAEPATPDTMTIVVLNAAYDTLYAGPDRVIPVDDRHLGDREPLMVEVCGLFDDVVVCEQEAVEASPKRIRVTQEITYPEDVDYQRGRYDLRFAVERRTFDGEGWERIDPGGDVQGYLLAYVTDPDEDGVRVPFDGRQGRFDLARLENYDEFKYQLKSKFFDDREADVHFDVYAGLGAQTPVRLTSASKHLKEKTEEERAAEVQHFVQQAAREILDRLGVGTARRRARAYIDRWEFNELTATYVVDLELEWREGSRFFGRRYDIAGTLTVEEAGTDAGFRIEDTHGRGERQWDRLIGDEELKLGPLAPLEDEQPPYGASSEVDAEGEGGR